MDVSILKRIKNGIDEILYDYESFETIPIVNRDHHINFLKEALSLDEISTYLMNLAILYINEARLCAFSTLSSINSRTLFLGILLYEDDYQDAGFYIPYIIVSQHSDELVFYNSKEKSSLKGTPFTDMFSTIVGLTDFELYIEDDTNNDVGRSYLFVPKQKT